MQTVNLALPISLLPPEAKASATQVDDLSPVVDERSTLGLVELILKNPDRVDRLTREDSRQPELITRFLAISLIGFTIFGIAATIMLNAAVTTGHAVGWLPGVPVARWGDRSLPNLTLAYSIGLVAATGVVLPSFYFFGLLAGVKTSMLSVLAHSMKGKAVAAVTLVGILPIYVAVVLGMIVFKLPEETTRMTLYLALALPFFAGLNGVRSLYVGFMGLADTLPPHRRCKRECLLRRLVLAWSACYTAVSPLMVFTLWRHFSG